MRQSKPPEPGADTGSRLQRDKPNSPHRGRQGSAQERADRAAIRAAKIEEREASRAAAHAADAAMDAQATVLAAERAAPKVVAARKEELDLEQRMQLVFEQEEMQQEQERQSAAREDQQERSDEPASQKYEDGNACGGAPLEMVGATQQQAADGRRQRAVQCKDAKQQEQGEEGDTPEQQQPGVPVRELATVPVS